MKRIGYISFMLLIVPLYSIQAANVTVPESFNVTIGSDTVEVQSGSQYDQLEVNAGNAIFTLSSDGILDLRSYDKKEIISTPGAETFCTDSYSYISVNGNEGAVTITVGSTTCSSNTGSITNSGGGGSIKPPSVSGVSITINDNATETETSTVTLTFNVTSATEVFISNSNDFTDAQWQSYTNTVTWDLEEGLGEKTVYARFKNIQGAVSPTAFYTINVVASSQTPDQQTSKTGGTSAQDNKQTINNTSLYNRIKGKIILKVEDNGEAYYVHPEKQEMYYLGRPHDAFSIMRDLGIGITDNDIDKILIGHSKLSGNDEDADGLSDIFEDAIHTDKSNPDTDGDSYLDGMEVQNEYSPLLNLQRSPVDTSFSRKHAGKIFLQVQNNGEAWMVNPTDNKRYFLGRPADAFEIMKTLGLGISTADFNSL